GVDNKEVTFKDIIKGIGKSKASYIKIRFYKSKLLKMVSYTFRLILTILIN
ncbi:hypothetical protein V2W45_1226180, partial [Cenococcum geophilum]